MVYITTKAKEAQHERTSRDVYFENLEEAYGNLPVPSDDYADIKQLLVDYRIQSRLASEQKGSHIPDQVKLEVAADMDKLQEATELILSHYEEVAKALGVTTKFA